MIVQEWRAAGLGLPAIWYSEAGRSADYQERVADDGIAGAQRHLWHTAIFHFPLAARSRFMF